MQSRTGILIPVQHSDRILKIRHQRGAPETQWTWKLPFLDLTWGLGEKAAVGWLGRCAPWALAELTLQPAVICKRAERWERKSLS